MAPPNTYECQYHLNKFLSIASYIGFPIKEAKTVLPTTCLEFMGIVIENEGQVALEKCQRLLLSFLSKEKATLKELQSLIGLLSFTCKVLKATDRPNSRAKTPHPQAKIKQRGKSGHFSMASLLFELVYHLLGNIVT